MIRNKLSIERVINERHYQFLCPPEASLYEVQMILNDIQKYINERIEEATKQVEEQKRNESEQPSAQKGE